MYAQAPRDLVAASDGVRDEGPVDERLDGGAGLGRRPPARLDEVPQHRPDVLEIGRAHV